MKILITLFFIMSSFGALAQEKIILTESKKITGVITDSEGMPIPGADVTIEGTQEKVQTDFDGNYTINAKEGEKLVATYVGMIDETITINKQNAINFKLRDDPSTDWNDKCYAPYLKSTKKITAISSESTGGLNPEFIKMRQDTTGIVKDGCVGGETKNRIRFVCLGSTFPLEPLYVIDSVPLNADNFKAISPDEIISIDILKNEGATSIYGNRGENGVIIVKTIKSLTNKEKRKLKREQKKLEKEE